jgi:hypothetical protein
VHGWHGSQGKTSLLDALRRGAKARLADADTERTIGLDIRELVLHDPRARGGGRIRGNAFDAGGASTSARRHPRPASCSHTLRVGSVAGCVAGHEEYQQMLAAFYTLGALYLLLFDVSAPSPPVEALRQWITSIQACAPGAVVILVGRCATAACA